MPNGRCRMHSGGARAGAAHPRFKHGRHSKSLPTRLAGRYAEARRDRELLTLRDEVALTDARLAELLARVETGESGALWRELHQADAELTAAQTAGDSARAEEALRGVRDLIGRGHADHAAWREAAALLDQRRRLVESERKRLVAARQMLSAEEAMALMAAVVDTIRRHVSDRETLAAISAEFGRLAVAQPA